jgi:hypothetical protein
MTNSNIWDHHDNALLQWAVSMGVDRGIARCILRDAKLEIAYDHSLSLQENLQLTQRSGFTTAYISDMKAKRECLEAARKVYEIHKAHMLRFIGKTCYVSTGWGEEERIVTQDDLLQLKRNWSEKIQVMLEI